MRNCGQQVFNFFTEIRVASSLEFFSMTLCRFVIIEILFLAYLNTF